MRLPLTPTYVPWTYVYVRPLDVRMSLGRTSHGRASHGRALALAYPFRCLRDALRLSRSGILACPYWVGGSWPARLRAETLRPSLPREGAPPFLPYGPVALRAPRRALGVRPSATRHVVEAIVTSSSRARLSRAPHDSLTCFRALFRRYTMCMPADTTHRRSHGRGRIALKSSV